MGISRPFCIHGTLGHGCNNPKVQKSFFGLGLRVCVDQVEANGKIDCLEKKRPTAPPGLFPSLNTPLQQLDELGRWGTIIFEALPEVSFLVTKVYRDSNEFEVMIEPLDRYEEKRPGFGENIKILLELLHHDRTFYPNATVKNDFFPEKFLLKEIFLVKSIAQSDGFLMLTLVSRMIFPAEKESK